MNPLGQAPTPVGEMLLGVDGGGTRTQAVVADVNGRILARGLGPSSNQSKVGFDKATQALTMAIEGAMGQLPVSRSAEGTVWTRIKIAAACLGIAGVDTGPDQEVILKWLRRQGVTSQAVVVNDSELILLGGTPEGWGVGLISGTGSICMGRARDGRAARVGGWGHLFGDEGSAYQIGMEALRMATHAADGRGNAAGLLRGILSQWRLRAPEELIRHVYGSSETVELISQLALAVEELAGRGDADARESIDRAGKALAVHVDTVVRTLDLQRPPLALGGMTLRGSLKKSLMSHLSVPVGPVTVVQDPAQAAVTMAQRLLRAPGRTA
jgi:N-acetylglucosamine kinase-like BadF-type ATPase